MEKELQAIRALRRLIRDDDPCLEEALVGALGHRLRGVRVFAALAVAELFQDVRAVPGLAEALLSGDPKQQIAASSLLWELGDLDTKGLLRVLYRAPTEVRDTIANALYWIGWSPDDADSAVAYFVTTQQWRECIGLASEAVPGLVRALTDWDGVVRRGAAWALGEIGDARAVDGLASLLKDQQGNLFGDGARVCDIAAEALAKIGTEDALRALERWEWDRNGGG